MQLQCKMAHSLRPCLTFVQVSREHATVTASDATCAVVRALKRSYMTRAALAPEAGPEVLSPLDVTQVQTALFSG